jgi:aspartate/methionine/tyrosine aminotransferase
MREFKPFEMEQLMSRWEQVVELNLSESGVHPLSLGELLDEEGRRRLLEIELGYPQVEGTVALRELIAGLYGAGAAAGNVLVTVGCCEALTITLQTLAAEGGEIAVMLPNYLHLWGTAHNVGLEVREFHLDPGRGWALDVDALEKAVTPRTRAVAVCNPNNPTGRVLSEDEMEAVVAAAARVGAWIVADEVYSGAEREREAATPSFWGRYDRVLALNSLSKAYGLPGLRLGWVVAPTDMVQPLWRRHEYATLACTRLANRLAEVALSPAVRSRLLERTRRYVRRGFEQLAAWLAGLDGLFDVEPPAASAVALVRCHAAVSSLDLVDRLIREQSVLVVPGEHFGVERHVRIGFGTPSDYLAAGLERIAALARTL